MSNALLELKLHKLGIKKFHQSSYNMETGEIDFENSGYAENLSDEASAKAMKFLDIIESGWTYRMVSDRHSKPVRYLLTKIFRLEMYIKVVYRKVKKSLT